MTVSNSRFWTSLIITSMVVTGLIIWVHTLELLKPFQNLSFISITLLFIFTVVLFFAGKMAIQSSNKYAFIQLVIANVLFKIILAVGLVVIYVKLHQPVTKFFILPFIAIYIVYSVFETWMLYRLALTKTTSDHE